LYFKNDTLGRYLYPIDNSKPSNEGKLKSIIDPDGRITNYYYHPIVSDNPPSSEDVIRPRIKYFKVLDNTNLDDTLQVWEDSRKPVIIYNYPTSNYKLSDYNTFDPSGNVLTSFQSQRYASTFNYDKIGRITKVMLPYDFNFSDTSYTVEIFIDTTFYPEDTVIYSAGVGHYFNFPQNYNWFITGNPPVDNGPYDSLMYMYIDYDPVDPDHDPNRKNILPLFSIDENSLQNFDNIDNAFLDFYPSRFTSTMNPEDYKIVVKTLNAVNPNTGQYTLGNGVEIINQINTNSEPITNCNGALYFYQNFYNTVNITNAVKSQISVSPMQGILFDLDTEVTSYRRNAIMDFTRCVKYYYLGQIDFSSWKLKYAPKIRIQGTKFIIDTTIIRNYKNASIRYIYDDINNRTEVYSKLAGDQMVRNDYLFDGFYKIKKTRKYKGKFKYDSTETKYNFLDLNAESIDGLNNTTKFSYDRFKNQKETQNADNSISYDSVYHQNSYNYSFGTISGLVSIKIYKDETDRIFTKIYDAVGNLRREISQAEDPDPSTPIVNNLVTDYNYDALYRVTQVRTPANKIISYSYDGYSRKYSETTVDAGIKKYKYDKSDNLTYTQDQVQNNIGRNTYTFYTYDGIERVRTVGYLTPREGDSPPTDFDDLTGEQIDIATESNVEDFLLTVNVYDTLSNAGVSLFSNVPSDYYDVLNNTKGNLVATAYRTLLNDTWSFKYYRYDARGRVIRMWNLISGYSTKVFDYIYNSSNQLAYVKYQTGENDFRMFRQMLDSAGRLQSVDLWSPATAPDTNEWDAPTNWDKITGYGYNQNSLISRQDINTNTPILYDFVYDTRNRITEFSEKNAEIFNYKLSYQPNSNISNQILDGSYKNNMSNNEVLEFNYTYDKSNRLLNADFYDGTRFDVTNRYDYDGNFTSMARYSSFGGVLDNFAYVYNSGTNKLQRVTGTGTQFEYDGNGNLKNDYLAGNLNIKYDHRNLITQVTKVLTQFPPANQVTLYRFDEEGNRTRKVIYNTSDPDPEFPGGELDKPPSGWDLVRDEFYIRGADGLEFAVYNSYDLDYYNVWAGSENVAKITSNNDI
ncbi:MAG TPA: hypothetical protein DEP28_05885, partial [Bacteroidetes bacterium]|nr:hypothetical protein [Bacteroidota bacterium]